MSNFEARKLYENIVEDVINESRQDFENSGIDESTLQELRRIWCEKLSQTQVAKFSWDDEDNIASNASVSATSATAAGVGGVGDAPSGLVDGGEFSLTEGGSNGLEVSAIQNGVLAYATVQDGLGVSKTENVDDDNGTGLLLPKIGQADGTFEFTVYTDDAKQLMKDLKAKNSKSKKINQADGNFGDDDDDDDDDIFNDSDDINSDLDDDLESDKSDGESGDQEGQLMLCLYDKVQRIKNKWKSNLKEGVANIDGKDYVFHKATGESEW